MDLIHSIGADSMKSIRNVLTGSLLAAAALLGPTAGSSIAAADEAALTAPAPPPGREGWRPSAASMRLLRMLDLTTAQQESIKAVISAAKPQIQSLHAQLNANMFKLRKKKPEDPDYSSVNAQVDRAQEALTTQLATRQAELRAQVFKVLTPAQLSRLQEIEAAHAAMRRRAHAEKDPAIVE